VTSDLDALIRIFDHSTWREMHVIGEGIDLFLSKDPNARRPAPAASAVPDGPQAMPVEARVAQPSAPPVFAPSASTAPAASAAAANAAGSNAPAPSVPAHWVTVRAPCLGTFYSSPKPGAAAFVSMGQPVTADTELCLVEVMKLFTTVRAGVNGTVRRRLVADATLVEFDQPLFFIEPHD
jgi:acetyl-CoA carboxylase biotin carboxyl carrier protein